MEINEQVSKQLFSFPMLEKVLLGSRIKHVDEIADVLREDNDQRERMADTIYTTMVNIFSFTKSKYGEYQDIVRGLNAFFKGKKISNRYFFQVRFASHPNFGINWINDLHSLSETIYRPGQFPLGDDVETFVEEFFQKATRYNKRIRLADLLDPKSYFELSVSLTDENNKDIPGSTGEAYSALVLLGIGRLSKVQNAERPGIRFIILEEAANLDRTNFNTFPSIAEEFGYQIITMTPKPYGSDIEQGWYLHHLFSGSDDPNINYPIPASYYKTNKNTEDLQTYLSALE